MDQTRHVPVAAPLEATTAVVAANLAAEEQAAALATLHCSLGCCEAGTSAGLQFNLAMQHATEVQQQQQQQGLMEAGQQGLGLPVLLGAQQQSSAYTPLPGMPNFELPSDAGGSGLAHSAALAAHTGLAGAGELAVDEAAEEAAQALLDFQGYIPDSIGLQGRSTPIDGSQFGAAAPLVQGPGGTYQLYGGSGRGRVQGMLKSDSNEYYEEKLFEILKEAGREHEIGQWRAVSKKRPNGKPDAYYVGPDGTRYKSRAILRDKLKLPPGPGRLALGVGVWVLFHTPMWGFNRLQCAFNCINCIVMHGGRGSPTEEVGSPMFKHGRPLLCYIMMARRSDSWHLSGHKQPQLQGQEQYASYKCAVRMYIHMQHHGLPVALASACARHCSRSVNSMLLHHFLRLLPRCTQGQGVTAAAAAGSYSSQ